MKKYILALVTVLLLLTLVPIWAFAHSGGTDSNGGHYDHSTGEYHYHHGYPAHQHTGGRCPYDYEDRTDSGSSSNSSSSGYKSSHSSSDYDRYSFSWGIFLLTVIIDVLFLVILNNNIFNSKKTPNWLSNILELLLALFFIALPIANLICIVYNFWSTVASGVTIFGGWYCIIKYKEHTHKQNQHESENGEDDK